MDFDFKPVRKVIHRANRKNVGYFPSVKLDRNIVYESLLEADYIHLFEFNKDVIIYCEQPLDIVYKYKGQTRHYYPDFVVKTPEKIIVFEVKPHNKLNDEKLIPKFYAGMSFCESKGYDYKIVTEKHINKFFLDNIKILFSYARLNVPASFKLTLRNILSTYGPMEFEELVFLAKQEFIHSREIKPYIFNLLYRQELKTSLNAPINNTSLIKL